MTSLDERLGRGEVILMDGAVGTEFQKHGVAMGWKASGSRTRSRRSTARPSRSPSRRGRQAVEVAVAARDNAARARCS